MAKEIQYITVSERAKRLLGELKEMELEQEGGFWHLDSARELVEKYLWNSVKEAQSFAKGQRIARASMADIIRGRMHGAKKAKQDDVAVALRQLLIQLGIEKERGIHGRTGSVDGLGAQRERGSEGAGITGENA
jgi:hypothetical protein